MLVPSVFRGTGIPGLTGTPARPIPRVVLPATRPAGPPIGLSYPVVNPTVSAGHPRPAGFVATHSFITMGDHPTALFRNRALHRKARPRPLVRCGETPASMLFSANALVAVRQPCRPQPGRAYGILCSGAVVLSSLPPAASFFFADLLPAACRGPLPLPEALGFLRPVVFQLLPPCWSNGLCRPILAPSRGLLCLSLFPSPCLLWGPSLFLSLCPRRVRAEAGKAPNAPLLGPPVGRCTRRGARGK
jgi:hypothetical protein